MSYTTFMDHVTQAFEIVAAIREKIERLRERLPVVIAGQLALEDYPEVFSDAA